MRVAIENLHSLCENNTHALTRGRSYFLLNGHTLVDSGDRCDLLFIGGCTVTDIMRDRCFQSIADKMAMYPGAMVIVFGCLSAFPDALKEKVCLDHQRLHIISYQESALLDALLSAKIPYGEVTTHILHGHIPYQQQIGSADSYVHIAHGCVNDCSYCNIKLAKGRVTSRPPAVIEEEVRALYRDGITVITLLGDDCGSYGLDRGTDLPTLLESLAAISPDLKFKLFTIFPALYLQYAERLEPFFAARRIPYICLPVQSASPRLLKLMNREYDPASLERAIFRIRSLDADAYIYSHFMFNFPTETMAELVQSTSFARLFNSSVFIGYGENSATRAASLHPRIDSAERGVRNAYLHNLIRRGELSAFLVPQP